jgi:hypothetical protein
LPCIIASTGSSLRSRLRHTQMRSVFLPPSQFSGSPAAQPFLQLAGPILWVRREVLISPIATKIFRQKKYFLLFGEARSSEAKHNRGRLREIRHRISKCLGESQSTQDCSTTVTLRSLRSSDTLRPGCWNCSVAGPNAVTSRTRFDVCGACFDMGPEGSGPLTVLPRRSVSEEIKVRASDSRQSAWVA